MGLTALCNVQRFDAMMHTQECMRLYRGVTVFVAGLTSLPCFARPAASLGVALDGWKVETSMNFLFATGTSAMGWRCPTMRHLWASILTYSTIHTC